MPASVSVKPCGSRIWFRRDETLLKKPTYIEKATKMSQNSTVRRRERVAWSRGVRGIAEEALGGVGGAVGRKNDGMQATVDYTCMVMVSFEIFILSASFSQVVVLVLLLLLPVLFLLG